MSTNGSAAMYGKRAGNPYDPSGLELATAERNHIEHVLGITAGNKTQAAELLGVHIRTLRRKLALYRERKAT